MNKKVFLIFMIFSFISCYKLSEEEKKLSFSYDDIKENHCKKKADTCFFPDSSRIAFIINHKLYLIEEGEVNIPASHAWTELSGVQKIMPYKNIFIAQIIVDEVSALYFVINENSYTKVLFNFKDFLIKGDDIYYISDGNLYSYTPTNEKFEIRRKRFTSYLVDGEYYVTHNYLRNTDIVKEIYNSEGFVQKAMFIDLDTDDNVRVAFADRSLLKGGEIHINNIKELSYRFINDKKKLVSY